MTKKFRFWIWVLTSVIVAFGLITLYSASFDNVRVSHQVFYDQLFFSCIGFFIMFLLSRMDFRQFFDVAYLFYGLIVVLLILVLFSGRLTLGAQRWLSIGGLSFQPSEFAKLALILALARYFCLRRPALTFRLSDMRYTIWKDLVLPFFIAIVPMFLIFKQPDLGTAVLIFGIFLVMLFVSGLEIRFIMGFLGLCFLVLPFGWHILKEYQRDRLLVFMNPNIDPLGAGYTIIQSKIAIGSGRFFGKGWLSGTQNQLNFLPERHTDFIFSVVGEEWGFWGGFLLVSCYFILILLGLSLAKNSKDKFAMLVASGIIGIFAMQVIINISMVLGLSPVVGITLPLVSYGRTSFLVTMIMIGLLLSLSKKRTVF